MMTDMYEYEQTHDQQLLNNIHVAALAKVKSFDKSKMTVEVQPLAKSLEGGSYTSQPPILEVPVAVTRIGGFLVRPWIKSGDVGAIIYPDHDMDSALAGGKESEPLTQRNHAPSDAVFVGGVISGSYTAPTNIPGEAWVVCREDGKIFLSVEKEKVKIRNEEDVEIEVIKDEIDVKNTDDVTLKIKKDEVEVKNKSTILKVLPDKVEITGNVEVKGLVRATGGFFSP